jgi:hypothetical protein
MHRLAKCAVGALCLSALAGISLGLASAHEGHKMECNETHMNAMQADLQAMKEGEHKTAAMKEMQLAQDMMDKDDMDGCASHMHKAMEEMEK